VNDKNDFEELYNEILRPSRAAVEYYNPRSKKV
jgi:hypothetical protein